MYLSEKLHLVVPVTLEGADLISSQNLLMVQSELLRLKLEMLI